MSRLLFYGRKTEKNDHPMTVAVRATTYPIDRDDLSNDSDVSRGKLFKLITLWTILASAALAALLLMPGRLHADPSTSDPFDTLTVMNPELSGPIVEKAADLYKQIYQPVIELSKNGLERNERVLKQQIPKIGSYYVTAMQIQRLGKRLIAMREPAGVDIVGRGEELRAMIRNVSLMMAKDEAYIGAIERITGTIEKRKKSFEDDISKIERHAQKEEWEEVHKETYDIIDGLHELCVWKEANKSLEHYKPFGKLQQLADTKVAEALSAAAVKRLNAMAATQKADYETLARMTDEAIASIRANGTADLIGRTMSGPDLLRWFISSWQTVQNRAIRLRAINWLLERDGDSRMTSNLQRTMNQFHNDASGRIISIIEADATSLSADKIRNHYILYLATLGRLLPLIPQPDRRQAEFEKALQSLVEKSPELVKEVDNYRLATSDLLRWRKLWTEQRIAFRWKDTVAPSDASLKTPIRRGSDLKKYHFGFRLESKSAPTDIRNKSPELVGSIIGTGPFRGQGPLGTAISGYEQLIYARITIPPQWKEETEKLRKDLYCETGSGGTPLTLEAALAVISASEGHASLVGGKVTEVTMQSQMPFFIGMSDIDGRLAPLGPDLRDAPDSSAMKGTISQITIEPTWLAGPGFFIELEPPAEENPTDPLAEVTEAPPES